MQDENPTRRRSSRSTSRTPAMEVTERIEINRSEPVVKITKFQSIEEMVYHEGHVNQVVTSASSISKQSFVHTDLSVESQNRQNQSKELSKSISQSKAVADQAQKKVKRTTVRRTQNSINGSSPVKRVRKTVSSTSGAASSVQDSESTSSSTTTRSSRAVEHSGNSASSSSKVTHSYEALTPKNADRARRFYDSVMKGEVDMSNSTFMRFYKPLEEWWNYYPKTDNTYSPHSSCRHELAPGVMAMPNLSRRSISGIRTPILSSVRKSWTELERNMDSDTEEWENRATNTSSTYQQRTSVFTRVVTSIWTVFTVIYAYTIGSVISLFTSAGSSRRQDGRKVPLLLYPIWWLVRCARRVTLWETQIGAWLSKGQRRNFLLGLLLLLLVAVPIYFLYAGGYEFTVMNDLLSELKAKFIAPTLAYLAHTKNSLVEKYYSLNITIPFYK